MKFQIYGDSHSSYFRLTPKMRRIYPLFQDLSIDVNVYRGGSVIGLARPESKLNIVKDIFSKIDNEAVQVFNFGQVDFELGYYYRLIQKGEDISRDDFLRMMLNAMSKFLESLNPELKLVVKGLNLSVLKDPVFSARYIAKIINNDNGLYDEKLSLLKQSLETYSELNKSVLRYNKELRELCCKLNIRYFDINDSLSLGEPLNGIDHSFIPCGPDHHIVDSMKVRAIHYNKLLEVV